MMETIDKISLALGRRENRQRNGWLLGIAGAVLAAAATWLGSTVYGTIVKAERFEVRLDAVEEPTVPAGRAAR
jgi:hypothetical protein